MTFTTLRTYKLVCHGCGREHEKQAYFLSLPMSVRLADGRELGVMACDDCAKQPGVIRAAYQRIMRGGPTLPQRTT